MTFFLTPFVVRTLGDAVYGVWVLIMSFVGYANILELGLQRAVVKLVSENRAAGDSDKLNALIDTALVFFTAAGLVTAIVLSTALPLFIDRFVSDVSRTDLRGTVFILLGINTLTIFLGFVFTGVLFGWQLYHVKNAIDITATLVNAVLVFAFLRRGGLVALIGIKAATDLAALLATMIACRQAFPGLVFRMKSISRRSFKELFSFGGRVFVSSTMARIATHTQPVIVSSFVNAAATTYFAIPKRLVDFTREIHWSLAAGFMPAFSGLNRAGETLAVRKLYLQYSRYILLLMAPVVVLLYAYGPDFIGIWIGPEYKASAQVVLYLLAAAYLAELSQPLLWSLFIGIGRLNAVVVIGSAMSALTILGSILLVGPLGINGVAAATLGSGVLAQIAFTTVLCRELEIGFGEFARRVYVRPLAAAAAVLTVATVMGEVIGKNSYVSMGLGAIASLLCYGAVAYWVAVTDEEKHFVMRKIREAVAARRRGAM